MGIVREELKHDHLPIEIMVVEKTPRETVEPWRIVSVDLDGITRMTPREMRALGKWLTEQGKRIGREYTSSGRVRARP